MKELTPIKALRSLTGIYRQGYEIQILVFVNLLARYLDHDELLEDSFLLEQFEKIGIKLILENKND